MLSESLLFKIILFLWTWTYFNECPIFIDKKHVILLSK